jgi:hypothetical protein
MIGWWNSWVDFLSLRLSPQRHANEDLRKILLKIPLPVKHQ